MKVDLMLFFVHLPLYKSTWGYAQKYLYNKISSISRLRYILFLRRKRIKKNLEI